MQGVRERDAESDQGSQPLARAETPSAWPDYLGHEHTVQYLSAYVDAFALRPCIECNREVRSVARRDDGGFEVVVENLSPPVRAPTYSKKEKGVDASERARARNAKTKTKTEVRAFDAVAVCAGQLSAPNVPDDTAIPGLSGFTGTITHTSEYRTSVPFAGKRVLVVGVGAASSSGVAQDLCGVAAKTTLAARSHRWLVRRGPGGGRRSLLTRVTNWLPASLGLLLHLYAEMIPALRALARTKGATDGGDFLAAAALGRIRIKPALASVRGDQVTFEDGSSDRFDAVIFATGFTRDLPFSFSLAKRKGETRRRNAVVFDTRREEEGIKKRFSPPRLYRGVLCADAPRVAFVLYVLPFGSHFQVAELQAAWAARVWRGELGTPSAEDIAAARRAARQARRARRDGRVLPRRVRAPFGAVCVSNRGFFFRFSPSWFAGPATIREREWGPNTSSPCWSGSRTRTRAIRNPARDPSRQTPSSATPARRTLRARRVVGMVRLVILRSREGTDDGTDDASERARTRRHAEGGEPTKKQA